MIDEHARDPLLDLVARLPKAVPPPATAERVRARCHAVLNKQRHRRAAPPERRVEWILVDATALAGAFMYVAGAVAEAVKLITQK